MVSYRTLLAVAATLTVSLVAGCASSSGPAGGTAGGSDSPSSGIPARPASTAVTLKESGSTLLYPLFGVTLSPAFSAAAMALSSVSVVANALRLRTVVL